MNIPKKSLYGVHKKETHICISKIRYDHPAIELKIIPDLFHWNYYRYKLLCQQFIELL